MKTNAAVCGMVCELCGEPAEYCDTVPDSRVTGTHPSECGYRLKAFCWLHGVERKSVATSRVEHLLRCESQRISRIDRDRAGGDVVCEGCGRKYYDHPQDIDYPFLNVLCDGSLVKL